MWMRCLVSSSWRNGLVRKVSKQPTQSIRNKFMFSFLTMIIIFTSVSFCSYYSQRNLLSRINSLLANSIKLREFSSNIDNIVISLEKFLIERSSDMLRSYHHYYQEVESEYTNLQVIEESIENYLLLKNIKTMTRLFAGNDSRCGQGPGTVRGIPVLW